MPILSFFLLLIGMSLALHLMQLTWKLAEAVFQLMLLCFRVPITMRLMISGLFLILYIYVFLFSQAPR
jgi:hypothetical protein